ncbi:HDAC7 isoform 9 [Pan troglodytes]|uniref:Histone deacetylase 7 n=2 Tax=Homininae TaxID=207598 RepID=C9JKN3_HUMAN|nr:histone deacetylase 7 [Homo sapiens]KAI4065551.1 histone deacetylase 7 [Homo sapiens]PNI49543.1 HDAC7 isoform 9 [Pan troglodytes]
MHSPGAALHGHADARVAGGTPGTRAAAASPQGQEQAKCCSQQRGQAEASGGDSEKTAGGPRKNSPSQQPRHSLQNPGAPGDGRSHPLHAQQLFASCSQPAQ